MSKKNVIIVVAILAIVAAMVVAVTPVAAAPPANSPYQVTAWEVAAELAGSFLFLLAVATAIEAVVTTFRWLVDKLPGESPKTYVLGVLGVGFSILFGINVFEAVAVSVGFVPPNPETFYWAGLVLTGLLAGSGAQVIHQWLKGLGIGLRIEAEGAKPGWP